MTSAFKHRLLGTVILVLAGVIFLPDLLDGEKQVVKDDFKVIPERPEFEAVPNQQAVQTQSMASVRAEIANNAVDEPILDQSTATEQSEQLPAQQYAQVTVPSETSTSVNNSNKLQNAALSQAAWVVSVGSFSKEQNANALMAKLRQAGFASFTRSVTNSNGLQLTSVLVGPELKKERLEQQLPKLQKITGIERLRLVNYQPTENN
ncbi:SPOR domain-containing protein [Rheinheimera salexigens]|uniref:DedD protein n=1 Tax=Rheinheimera salexigens TaxID=1628148 RepID=A0A1E7Q5B4_9GAMM|nr:SPOR domain-containing protein [Rheinheimera salexigens]OEY69263.1 dedD protein [Rheinheimera salexigens]